MVDILSSLPLADDYREVMRLLDRLILTEQDSFQNISELTSFIFDNADVNVRKVTARDTWHALGRKACTPAIGDICSAEPNIPRYTKMR